MSPEEGSQVSQGSSTGHSVDIPLHAMPTVVLNFDKKNFRQPRKSELSNRAINRGPFKSQLATSVDCRANLLSQQTKSPAKNLEP